MNKIPRLSVVLPAYNAEKTIRRAIESILNQTFKDFELIVINDGSIDRTAEIISSYTDKRINFVNLDKNEGLVSALNRGLKLSRGEFIARQDADDESLLNRFARQLNVIESDEELGVVGAATLLRTETGRVVGSYKYPDDSTLAEWQAIFKTPVAHSTVILRKSIIEAAGAYSGEYKYAEDFELWTRVARVGKIISLKEPLVYYAISEGGESQLNRNLQDERHVSIAQRNIEGLVGGKLDSKIVRALTLAVDRADESLSVDCVIESIRSMAQIRDCYVSKQESLRENKNSINLDYRDRVMRLFRKMRYTERIRNVGLIKSEFGLGLLAPRSVLSMIRV